MPALLRVVLGVTQQQVYDYTQCVLAVLGLGTVAILSVTGKPIPTELTWFVAALVGSYFKASPTPAAIITPSPTPPQQPAAPAAPALGGNHAGDARAIPGDTLAMAGVLRQGAAGLGRPDGGVDGSAGGLEP